LNKILPWAYRLAPLAIAGVMLVTPATSATAAIASAAQKEDVITLRVGNWEEYIDLGGWDEDEAIDLEEETIFGENSLITDFQNWFNEQDFGFQVNVEYSTFGTNEDLYNRLNLGDVYDVICPSDYMIIKLLAEDKLAPFSQEFLENGDYSTNVSPYIANVFDENGWTDYAACYMWGTTGLVYAPAETDEENEKISQDVSTWNIFLNEDYYKQITIKDNVRDAYFPSLAILNRDTLLTETDTQKRVDILNDTSSESIAAAQELLKSIKDNVYSFETDSGKSDMITGKVKATYQWSGDAVFIMDEADKEDMELWYSVPDECSNLWFDGWVMLKDGIGSDTRRQQAAEAFINYLSKPESAIRNMYFIGYTSAIADDLVFEYLDWNYGVEFDSESEWFDEELTELYSYDVSYFFGGDEGEYIIYADASTFDLDYDNLTSEEVIVTEDYPQNETVYTLYSGGTINRGRQLFAQYPTQNVISRSVVMLDFGDDLSAINQMWINVRCLDLKDFNPVIVSVLITVLALLICAIVIYHYRYYLFKPLVKKGYHKIAQKNI
jgi:spermidine/putrescine transport system substrate-binding protein